jgi:predicted NBD/HSP70 family sugar kinase
MSEHADSRYQLAPDSRAVPTLLPAQLQRFTPQALRIEPRGAFHAKDAVAALSGSTEAEVAEVIAVEIGGDKIVSARFQPCAGMLKQTTQTLLRVSNGGAGYLQVLEELAVEAQVEGLAVGISVAGLTAGTKLVAAANMPCLAEELQARYGSDFAALFPTVAVVNDAEATIMAGALAAARQDPSTRDVICLINGSGLGGAVLHDCMIFAAEPGHIEADPVLNPFNQRRPCGVLGGRHVCLESVAASKAGIESLWRELTGERRTGRELAATYLGGNEVALDLYDNSALVTAHIVKGMADAFGIGQDSAVILHGGIFHAPGYGERVTAILTAAGACPKQVLLTKEFEVEAGLAGAAVAAVAAVAAFSQQP